MKFNKATLTISHDDLIQIIKKAIEDDGWKVGEVTLTYYEVQRSEDRFSATIDVEGRIDSIKQTAEYKGH